eukprot:Hpha_TRINITY_DN15135_c3_g5::TRINITY_DN15135_c3_g5_i1::g.128240::m.128240/K00128/ALDH; aldehyde dehydrogenase (NAD+)
MTTNEGFAAMQRDVAGGSQEDLQLPARLVAQLRKEFDSGKTKSVAWRREQLERVQQLVEENHELVTAAVRKDHGGPKLRGFAELGPHKAATFALEHLDEWTAPEAVPTPVDSSLSRLGRSYIRKEPKGVVLIIAPWNFPFELSLTPLVAAIAAGNCVVIKPSEVAPNSALVLEQLIAKYLDPACVAVVQGAVQMTTALLKERWDHIFYTGNGHVGRIVLKAAAEHLTPVTLELGGKSPAIIDKSAKLDTAVARISAGKWLNAGQICVAPDYVLVHKDLQKEFTAKMAAQIKTSYGESGRDNQQYGRIINDRHVGRIASLVKGTQGKVVTGGAEEADPEKRYFPPTLVEAPGLDEPLLKEEIFGPVLPILPFSDISSAVDTVNRVCDRPLALYVFAEDKQAVRAVLDGTLSGGVGVNTTVEQLGNNHLPFGGVGSSGYGAYHGKSGFDEFSHRRSCLQQDTFLLRKENIPLAPISDKMYDLAVKATITGFLTKGQRTFLKFAGGAVILGAVGSVVRSRL